MEGKSNKRDILIEGTILGLGKNPETGKLPGIYKDDPGKTPSNSGEVPSPHS